QIIHPPSVPVVFLLCQLSGGGPAFAAKSVAFLRRRVAALDQLHEVAAVLGSFLLTAMPNVPILFGLDEADAGYERILPGFFGNPNGHNRGIASPVIQNVVYLSGAGIPVELIVAGTSLSLRDGKNVVSDFGKEANVKSVTDFAVCDRAYS